ncbi:MAG: glycoside hydrolase family 2 TIM barrel-domain containing protein [Anaerococcus sp.]|nr:glycoside hydrolase family 2 TIM barrel-domain containing protein [Anaerococcus sp.]
MISEKIEVIDKRLGTYDLGSSWKFTLGDRIGFYKKDFDDSLWEDIDLPHDYSIDRDYSKAGEAQSAYKLGGVGLYRKKFIIRDIRKVILLFDGLYCNARVYINEKYLGSHHHGYSPFAFDLTPYLYDDRPNLLAIWVDNPIPTSRWYSGSGIYRSVKLILKNKLSFDLYGIRIDHEDLSKRKDRIKLTINARLVNDSPFTQSFDLGHDLYLANRLLGSVKARSLSIPALSTKEYRLDFTIPYPLLWTLDDPKLHKLVSNIYNGESLLAREEIPYGFSYYKFDKDEGFSLNGEKIKLKGVCIHHDNGALGARDFPRASERKLRILKDMGANMIRITHNPGSKSLIDLANKLGFLLIEEIFDGWILDKNNNYNDYSKYFDKKIGKSELLSANKSMTWAEFDLKETLKRDYNAVAIIGYSLGNEILGGSNQSKRSIYPKILEDLIRWARQVDGKRFLSLGDNTLRDGYDPIFVKMEDRLSEDGSLVGLNYCDGKTYDKIHKDHPGWILWQSESVSSVNSRSCYDRIDGNLKSDMKLTSFDRSKVPWGSFAAKAHFDVIQRDFIGGQAVWTGFDYLGEPTPYNGIGRGDIYGFPAPRSSFFGINDLAGFAKDSYYLYRSLWNEDSYTCHLLPSYNTLDMEKIKGPIPLTVYTNASAVDLIFEDEDGKRRSLGKKYMKDYKTKAGHCYRRTLGEEGYRSLYMTWDFPFQQGSIRAIAYDKFGNIIKNPVGRQYITSKKSKASLRMRAFYPRMDGINFVSLDIVGPKGQILDNREDEIYIDLLGEGEVLGLDNGDPKDFTSFRSHYKKAYGGRLLLILRSKDNGSIKVRAWAKDLAPKTLSIRGASPSKKASFKKISRKDPKEDLKKRLRDDETYKVKALNQYLEVFKDEKIILAKEVPLVDNEGRLLAYGFRASYEGFDLDEFYKKKYYSIRGYVEDFNLSFTLRLGLIEESSMKDAYIEDFVLGKKLGKDEITYYFDSQQLIGEVELKVEDKETYKVLISEDGKTYERLTYKKTYKNHTLYLDLGEVKATYIKIQGNLDLIEKLRIRSVKIRDKRPKEIEISSIKVNNRKIDETRYCKKVIDIGEKIKDFSIKTQGHGAMTYLKVGGDIFVYLLANDLKLIKIRGK